jgi:hypothetical protein
VVDLPAGKVGAIHLPPLAVAIRRQNEGAFACAYQQPYAAHPSLLFRCTDVTNIEEIPLAKRMTARFQELRELRTNTESKLNALANTAEKLVRRNGNEELIRLISLFGPSLLPTDKVSEFHAKFKR